MADCDAERYWSGPRGPNGDNPSISPAWDNFYFYKGPDKDLSEFDDSPPFPVGTADVGQLGSIECYSPELTVINYCENDLGCEPYTQICLGGHDAICAFPCPSTLFTAEQYESQYIAYVVPAMIGLVMNCIMVIGLVLMRKKEREKLPTAIKMIFLLGVLFGIVDTLPVAIISGREGRYLACECDDEEVAGTAYCQGENAFCVMSRFGVFFLMAIFYCVATLNLNLYLRLKNRGAPTVQGKFGVAATNATTILCAIITAALDVDPQENPDAELAPLIVVQDSFSCSPRLPTFASDFLLRQIHFLIASAIVVVSVTMSVWKLSNVSSQSQRRGKYSTESTLGFVWQLKRQLVQNRATRLLVIGLIFFLLFLVNLFVTVRALPVLETFKANADGQRECLISYKASCGYWGYCVTRYDPESPCTAHSDCYQDIEYCKANGKCGRCFDCHLHGDGVGGTCPDEKCNVDVKMNDREICAFGNCGQEITDHSNAHLHEDLGMSVSSMIMGEGGCDDCALSRCLAEHSCLEESRSCMDPYNDLPGCSCLGICHISREGKLDDIQTMRICEGNLSDCRESLLQNGFDPELVFESPGYRRTCCFGTSPQPGVEQLDGTIDPICPQEDEVPNAFMIGGYFSMNCAPMVGPLVFVTSAAWWNVWQRFLGANKIFVTQSDGQGTIQSSPSTS